jgi:hypothetical protein
MIDEPRDPRRDDEQLAKGKEPKSGAKSGSRSTSDSPAGSKKSTRATPKREDDRKKADAMDESLRESRNGERGEVF